jgi:2-(3-amino-3-carboxypropyl)histidine synthase
MERDEIKTVYDLSLDKIIDNVKARKAKRIVLQFPDGLLEYATKIANEIGAATGSETIVSLDTCYGACDLATNAASRLNADLIIHFGHARWKSSYDVPVIYAEAPMSLDISGLLPKVKEALQGSKRIGVVSTVQHSREIGKVRRYLEDSGFTVTIGKGTGKVPHDGQVLGCDYSTATSISENVDRFVLIGAGRFHAIGLGLATRKESIVIDPYAKEVFNTNELLHRYLKARTHCIMEARTAKVFGIIIGLKFGQLDLRKALAIKDKLEKFERRVTLFCVDTLTPERLNSISGIDAFIITACPRLAIDDSELFKKPVLTSSETDMVFSDELLEDYLSIS